VIGNRSLRQEIKRLERIRDIWDTKDYNESVRKAQKMSSHACLNWIDQHINDIGQAADDYRRTGDEAYLQELRKAVSILQALTEELMFKSGGLSV
jgi:hypothetical protein